VFAISKNEDVKNSKSIKEKLGITTEDGTIPAVTDTFNALHEFIKAGGLTNENTKEMIKPGDYIDLEGGLTVAAYPDADGGGDFTYPGTSTNTRLIVVGINSFKTDTTVNENYVYPKASEEDDPPSHVVFQFQNIPVEHRMNAEDSTGASTNAGGYPASEMRKYLTPVDQVDGSGNFLAGLEKAGVPVEVLWGPSRVMSTKGGTKTINDLLWLPTEREMYGSKTHSFNDETKQNQPRLAYYGDDSFREKVDKTETNKTYCLASVVNLGGTSFCGVASNGKIMLVSASFLYGCAPAFCVQ
jgi:hypothetical protein